MHHRKFPGLLFLLCPCHMLTINIQHVLELLIFRRRDVRSKADL
jgi:hypothetical protein